MKKLEMVRKMESMEEIKGFLATCTKSELVEMAKEMQLTGVSSWKKEKLVEFVAETQRIRINSLILSQIDVRADWQR